ncbi:MAG: response regulator [Chthoniobacterales bacterium]|nr:response regulator [Chthoniobacterales bacterium]
MDQRTVQELPASIRTHSGETREVLITAQILNLGDAPYQLLSLQDITARSRLENELRQAQKMEAVGRLAAGVAHDFNNILTVILGNTSRQLRNPLLDEKLSVSLHQVERAAERATALTRQLLAYSRKQIIQRRPIALNGVIEQTVAMLRRVIGEHIAFDIQLTPDLPPVFADSGSVDQVIMNLALNARDAMPDGGKLTIATHEVETDETALTRNPEARPGRHIYLLAKDTGKGMDAATVARIFEPFFTTKGSGEGTGMDLATVYGVLKQQGGWIEVESAPRRGTAIRAFFPLSGMKFWSEHRDEIDLLLTDVVMPESISGRQLAHTLIVEKPDLKVIFTSGYSAELLGEDFEQEKEFGFLAKPYLPDRLASTVAAHLQRPPVGVAA